MLRKIKKKFKLWLGWGSKINYATDKEYILNPNKQERYTGKVAVVTGGGGALGRSICVRLASEGAKVYIAGRSLTALNKVQEEIRKLGFDAEAIQLDVNSEESIEKELGGIPKIDLLVNCAGGSTRDKSSELADQSVEVIDSMLNTNLRGTMLCCRTAIRKMREQQVGRIINISSAVGMRGMSKFSDYSASKAGVIGFSQSLALELAKYNITVNCVAPGFIQRGTIDEETFAHISKKCPMNKIGSHEDIANAVAFLGSDEAGFITGQNLAVDGGRTLGLYSER